MKNCCRLLMICLLPAAYAQQPDAVPRQVTFSGVLKDAGGRPLQGEQALSFSIYSEQDSRTPVWQETQNVDADADGRYTVHLGAAAAKGMPVELFTSGQPLWVGVLPQMAGAVEQPRVLLVSVPYAVKAADAETLGGRPASAYLTRDALASGHTAMAGASVAPSDFVPAANTVGGSGTADYIPLWMDANDLGNSLLFQSGGKIGFGTTAPGATFDVETATSGFGFKASNLFTMTSPAVPVAAYVQND